MLRITKTGLARVLIKNSGRFQVGGIVTESTEPILALPPTLSVASKTVSSVSLSWVENDNGDTTVTDYLLEYRKSSDTVYATMTVVSTSKTLFGLDSNTLYEFRVTKNTPLNNPVSSVVTDSTEPILALPPTLSVASKTVSSVSLSWVENDNGDTTVTDYLLEYKKSSDTVYATMTVISTSKTLFGLDSNTLYEFRVTKNTPLNNIVSSVVTDSTEPIQASAPTLSVASKTVSSVSLSWNPRGDHGDALVTGYELFYKKASESNFLSTSHPSSAFGADIVGLESNTAYEFRVTKNTDVNNPVSSVVTDSTLITRRIDIYMTESSTTNNVKFEELLFFDVYGVKCEYEITMVNEFMIGSARVGDSYEEHYYRLTQFYRANPEGSYIVDLDDIRAALAVGWNIDPSFAQSFYDQIMISVQVPKNAFRMVTLFKLQKNSASLFFDFPENPTGTPVYTHQNIARETGGDVLASFIDSYFTTDGTATGSPMFL
jgi:hypothetical protein